MIIKILSNFRKFLLYSGLNGKGGIAKLFFFFRILYVKNSLSEQTSTKTAEPQAIKVYTILQSKLEDHFNAFSCNKQTPTR